MTPIVFLAIGLVPGTTASPASRPSTDYRDHLVGISSIPGEEPPYTWRWAASRAWRDCEPARRPAATRSTPEPEPTRSSSSDALSGALRVLKQTLPDSTHLVTPARGLGYRLVEIASATGTLLLGIVPAPALGNAKELLRLLIDVPGNDQQTLGPPLQWVTESPIRCISRRA